MKAATIILVLAVSFLMSDLAQAQVTGGTGELGFQLGTYGRVRVEVPAYSAGTRHLERMSFIAALDSNNVFDYEEDAENVEPPSRTTGGIADTIATVLIDNSFSNLPPNVRVRVTVYAWNNDDFFIVKYTTTNINTAPYVLHLGAFVIPRPNGTYGAETVSYDATKQVAYYFRTGENEHVGVKVLSGDPYSFHVLDWDAYSPNPDGDEATDSTRYRMAATPGFDGALTAGVNGSCFNLNVGSYTIPPGDSASAYYAVIYTTNLSDLLLEADSAQIRYNGVFTGVEPQPSASPDFFTLSQNYPNPFNPATRITFQVKTAGLTTLTVYDMLGREVATLVNESLAPGSYAVTFTGDNLASGTYLYRLTAGSYSETRRMMIIR